MTNDRVEHGWNATFSKLASQFETFDPGVFISRLFVTPLSGTNLSPFTFRLHFGHHFPVDPVIHRFEAFTMPPADPESHEGTWRQLPN